MLHRWHEVSPHVDAAVWLLLLEELLEAVEAELVPVLELAVAVESLLHGVVGEVHSSVVDVLGVDREDGGRRADVTLLEEVEVVVLVQEHPDADVELAPADEEGPLDVLLDDEGVVLDLVAAALGWLLLDRCVGRVRLSLELCGGLSER